MSVIGELIGIGSNMLPMLAGGYGVYRLNKYINNVDSDPYTPEPLKIDGRTREEWYETIKSIGPEAAKELMLGPMDGLERDQSYAWNPEHLMGVSLWDKLQDEWEPWRHYPQTVVQRSTGIVMTYSKPDEKNIMTITMKRNEIEFSTEILAEEETFNTLCTMARAGLYQKVIRRENEIAAELLKKKKAKQAEQLRVKEAERLRSEQEWLRKAMDRQRIEPFKTGRPSKTPIQDILDNLAKQQEERQRVAERVAAQRRKLAADSTRAN